MNQIESKSILAKCLATEDISIVHDPKAPTAAFDVKARTLYLPLWKEMSPALYDLFIGHEVGHAHETPAEGWHDAVCHAMAKKNFLNVNICHLNYHNYSLYPYSVFCSRVASRK